MWGGGYLAPYSTFGMHGGFLLYQRSPFARMHMISETELSEQKEFSAHPDILSGNDLLTLQRLS